MTLDLSAYLKRIEFAGSPSASVADFQKLHLAHATHIPFENLDILLGRPIRIDLESIQAKLVHARRGGYCFEQNQLFAAVLQNLGLKTTYLAARVRFRVQKTLPRTHVLLLVEIDGDNWIADVGFGTVGILEPMPLIERQESFQYGWTYRFIRIEGTWILQSLQKDGWLDLYGFTLEPQEFVDLEMANHYVSTFPQSRFVQTLTAQTSTTAERRLLRNFDLIIDRGGESVTTTLRDQDELLSVLAEQFDLHFTAGTRFQIAGAFGTG